MIQSINSKNGFLQYHLSSIVFEKYGLIKNDDFLTNLYRLFNKQYRHFNKYRNSVYSILLQKKNRNGETISVRSL